MGNSWLHPRRGDAILLRRKLFKLKTELLKFSHFYKVRNLQEIVLLSVKRVEQIKILQQSF